MSQELAESKKAQNAAVAAEETTKAEVTAVREESERFLQRFVIFNFLLSILLFCYIIKPL